METVKARLLEQQPQVTTTTATRKLLIVRDDEALPSLDTSISSSSMDDSLIDDSNNCCTSPGRHVTYLLPSTVKPSLTAKTLPVACNTLLAGSIPLAKVHEETDFTVSSGSRVWLVGTLPREDDFGIIDEIRNDSPTNVDAVPEDVFNVEVSLRDFLLGIERMLWPKSWEEEICVNNKKVLVIENNNSWEVSTLEETPTIPNLTLSFDDSWSDDSSSSDDDIVRGAVQVLGAKASLADGPLTLQAQETSKQEAEEATQLVVLAAAPSLEATVVVDGHFVKFDNDEANLQETSDGIFSDLDEDILSEANALDVSNVAMIQRKQITPAFTSEALLLMLVQLVLLKVSSSLR
jgi:hypothetical protein